MKVITANNMRANLLSELRQITYEQMLLFKRIYSFSNLHATVYDIVNNMSSDQLYKALDQVRETIKINNARSASNMQSKPIGWRVGGTLQTKAGGYNPMPSKRSSSRHPNKITRCLDGTTGKYVLVKTHVFKGRRPERIEVEACELDCPAEFFYNSNGDIIPDTCYDVKLINYYLEKKNVNEYVLRDLIMMYLKSIRKATDSDVFKSACNVFDKADKMLSRCDRRKNSSIHESNVSYEFLIKNYKKIMTIVEVKKKIKVEDMVKPHSDAKFQEEYEKLMDHMMKNMGMAASHMIHGYNIKVKNL